MSMSHKLEPAAAIAGRLGRPEAEVAEQLAAMAGKGLLFRVVKNGEPKYGVVNYIHGLMEFQVRHINKQYAEMTQRYFKAPEFVENLSKSVQGFVRPIPVQKAVPVQHQVASFDDASEFMRKAKLIAVADCVCRKQTGMLGEGCGKRVEACFMFGSMAQFYLDHDMGRQVSAEEAIAILAECHEQGMVSQPGTAQNPAGMCNCCGDCCGLLRAMKFLPNPGEIVYSNHYAVLDTEECSGCETCLDRCQMDAISMNDDGLAVLDQKRCIGCGLCVTTCPTEAIRLVPKEKQNTPPETSIQQMAHIAQLRGLA